MNSIQVSPQQAEFLRTLKSEMHTQDGRITQDPIFQVRTKVVDWGIHPDYSEVEAFFDSEGNIVDSLDDVKVAYQDITEEDPSEKDWDYDLEDLLDEMQFGHAYGRESVDIVAPCFFSEKAAQAWLERNRHKIAGKPFIYADSAWDNTELKEVRSLLLNLTIN